MKLLFATGNQYKLNLMKERLACFEDIEVVSPQDLGLSIDVVEDGITAEENATKKAVAFHEASNLPTIAEDSGLYIEKFKEEEQPGLFVKRINGKEGISDDEILNYYIKKLKEHNGRSLAHYFTGVCIIDEEGNIHSDTITETEFLFVDKPSKRVNLKGGVLDSISYDLDCEKYFNDRTDEEKKAHFKELDEKYRNLIDTTLRQNKKHR